LKNKSVQTGDFYTQTLVTYDTSGDAKLTTCTNLLDKNRLCHDDSNENQELIGRWDSECELFLRDIVHV